MDLPSWVVLSIHDVYQGSDVNAIRKRDVLGEEERLCDWRQNYEPLKGEDLLCMGMCPYAGGSLTCV
jgi:hypothetical protein